MIQILENIALGVCAFLALMLIIVGLCTTISIGYALLKYGACS